VKYTAHSPWDKLKRRLGKYRGFSGRGLFQVTKACAWTEYRNVVRATEKAVWNTEAGTYWRIMFFWDIRRQFLIILIARISY
jgi:hypothetical protein